MRKLEEVGQEWIMSKGANGKEIEGWINGWKSLFGSRVMGIQVIKHYFNKLERLFHTKMNN